MKKKVILIEALDGIGWIGGLYYKKNILYSVTQNPQIMKSYSFVVVVNKGYESVFDELKDKICVNCIPYMGRRKSTLVLLFLALFYRAKAIFPWAGKNIFMKFGIQEVHWIPDFQFCYYPEYFSEERIEVKRKEAIRVLDEKIPLVLSSENAKEDYIKFFGQKKNIFVIPFVSYIEKEIRAITQERVEETLRNKGLEQGRYAVICNQFWQHKNHMIVLKAIELMQKKALIGDFRFVFTGNLQDDRNPEYCESIKNIFENSEISRYCIMLGFVPRDEQIRIISGARFVIQPSLFEGWGTVLEDAKVLDKRVILSDIPVHREQRNENCVLFDPHNEEALAECILGEMGKEHTDDMSSGLAQMRCSAQKYSINFEKMLDSLV